MVFSKEELRQRANERQKIKYYERKILSKQEKSMLIMQKYNVGLNNGKKIGKKNIN